MKALDKMQILDTVTRQVISDINEILKPNEPTYVGDVDIEKVKDSIANTLRSFQAKNIVAPEDGFKVGKVDILWNTWTDAQRIKWVLVNETHPEIAQEARELVDDFNKELYNHDTDTAEGHVDYPWWAIPCPQMVTVVDMMIKPVQAINFVTVNFELTPEAHNE